MGNLVATSDVQRIVMTKLQQIFSEVEGLHRAVSNYIQWQGHHQSAPHFVSVLQRRGFLDANARQHEGKRRIQIYPLRVACEIGEVQWVPG